MGGALAVLYGIPRVTFLFCGIRFCCGLYVYYTVGVEKPLAALRPLNKN